MLAARHFTALIFLFGPTAGCGQSSACPGGCSSGASTKFILACSASDIVSVIVSGPCAIGDAGLSSYFVGNERSSLYVSSAEPGTCHVQLVFATGYTYAADVQFTSQPGNVPARCGCSSYVAPTQDTFNVDNPRSTCQDAGADASTDS